MKQLGACRDPSHESRSLFYSSQERIKCMRSSRAVYDDQSI